MLKMTTMSLTLLPLKGSRHFPSCLIRADTGTTLITVYEMIVCPLPIPHFKKLIAYSFYFLSLECLIKGRPDTMYIVQLP